MTTAYYLPDIVMTPDRHWAFIARSSGVQVAMTYATRTGRGLNYQVPDVEDWPDHVVLIDEYGCLTTLGELRNHDGWHARWDPGSAAREPVRQPTQDTCAEEVNDGI